jgi:FMN phosphatase YigB (HAD superfamily)
MEICVEAMKGVRNEVYRFGKRVYRSIPHHYRDEVLHWAYRNIPFLFKGMPHFESWLNSRGHDRASHYTSNNLRDLNLVQQTFEPGGLIAVHLHIFYQDLVPEFAAYLKHMPFPYDLYVSVCDEETFRIGQGLFAELPHCLSMEIKQVANRGRDIAPLFCAFGDQLAKYDYIAHLHGKKSLYNNAGTEGWREYLCNILFGSGDRIRRIFTLMQGKKPCGIVYPQNFALLSYMANTWLANRELARVWCAKLGIPDIPGGYFDVATGSMFWARGDALEPLFCAGIGLDDFPEETGQTDGTLAHCIERLFVLCSLKQGMPPGIIKDDKNPSWSPWRFDRYMNRSYESLLRQIDFSGSKLVAFDIFDTLLCRPLLNPETIKRIVARRVGGETGRRYQGYRAIAEQEARVAKGLDVGLDEVYARLGEITGLDGGCLVQLRQIEEQAEKASLMPREEALQLFRDVLAVGKRAALITDMFLPRSVIETILRTHGVDGWDALFLSNEVGLRKDQGDLYQHVLSHYAIKPAQLVMVGDNERSDLQIPADMGASFIHLLKPVELARGLPRFSDLIARHEQSGDVDAEITLGLVVRKNFDRVAFPGFDPSSLVSVTPYNVGYSLAGPLLVSFARWLLQKVREDGMDRLYFLSREGKLIKRVYDYWVEGEKDAPQSEYLVVSRRTAGVAGIETMDHILGIARTIYFPNTLGSFLHTRFGLSLKDERWHEISRSLGWKSMSEVQVEDRQIKHLIPLLSELQTEIFAKARKERADLLRYLKEMNLSLDGRQAVVDVGYGGSVQGYLNRLLSRKVHGYYLMTDERAENMPETHDVLLRGCFYENVRQSSNAPVMYRESFNLERLLSSDEPQVEHYETDVAGDVKGRYRELVPAETACADLRIALQQGAMDYAKDARAIRETLLPDFQPSCWTARMLMESFLVQTSEMEQQFLSKIVLDDHYCGRGLVTS